VIVIQKNKDMNGSFGAAHPVITNNNNLELERPSTPPSTPPRYLPVTPPYTPHPIGSLLDLNPPPQLQTIWSKYVYTLHSDEKHDGEAAKGGNEEDEENDENDRFMKIREKALELIGGQEKWELLSEDECDALIEKASVLIHNEKRGASSNKKWKEFQPHSPDHPPPNYHSNGKDEGEITKMNVEEDEEQDDEGGDAADRILKVSQKAIELAGGQEVWDDLDEETCDAFIELAEQQV
jgi:hypothetical protein